MSTRQRPLVKGSNISSESATNDLPVDAPASSSGTKLKRQRVTPRNSIGPEDASTAKETPFTHIHELGRLLNRNISPATPLRRASSAGPISTHKSTRRTPIGRERTPGALIQPGSTRRPNVATPHGQAAVKTNELRRAAALTPARDMRRNGRRQQRDTPQADLRALSRMMASTSQAVERTPDNEVLSTGKLLVVGEDDLDSRVEARPRLSMPLDEDEDDSLLLPPMRSTDLVEDDNLTQRSVELPRRAAVGQPPGRLSRGSFGSVRTSDQIGNINELGQDLLAADAEDSAFIQQGDFDDLDVTNVEEDSTASLQLSYLEDGTGRISLLSGRTSDTKPLAVPEDDTDTTFILPLPRRDSLPNRSSIAEIEGSDEEEDRYDEVKDQSSEADEDDDSEIDQVDVGEENVTMVDLASVQSQSLPKDKRKSHRIKKRIKVSKYGIQYPSLPAGVVRKLAAMFLKMSGIGKAKLSKDTLESIMQASDWFFEQVSDDLGTYANHAGRKTIEDTDVVTLLKRQRQTNPTTTPFALAQRYLPRELLQELRMAQPSVPRPKKTLRLERVDEEDEAGDQQVFA